MAVTYKNAPISELVCGVVFNTGLLAQDGILYELVNEFKEKYPKIAQSPPILDEELQGFQLISSVAPQYGVAKFRMFSEDDIWLVQLQQNKVYFNWIRKDVMKVGNYPGFSEVFKEFLNVYKIVESKIKKSQPNLDLQTTVKQYELLYQDRLPWQTYMDDLDQIKEFLNIKIPTLPSFDGEKEYPPNNISSFYTIPVEEVGGYCKITVNTQPADIRDNRQILKIEVVLRGKNESDSIEKWFDRSNKIQKQFFEKFFSNKILTKWQEE